ncbi:unnamed protein product, partial [Hapterophycus canaliculatus]
HSSGGRVLGIYLLRFDLLLSRQLWRSVEQAGLPATANREHLIAPAAGVGCLLRSPLGFPEPGSGVALRYTPNYSEYVVSCRFAPPRGISVLATISSWMTSTPEAWERAASS